MRLGEALVLGREYDGLELRELELIYHEMLDHEGKVRRSTGIMAVFYDPERQVQITTLLKDEEAEGRFSLVPEQTQEGASLHPPDPPLESHSTHSSPLPQAESPSSTLQPTSIEPDPHTLPPEGSS